MIGACALTGSPASGLGWGSGRAEAADEADLNAVRRRLEDPDPKARAAAVRRLAGSVDPAAVKVVTATLADPHPHVRRAAAGALGVAIDRGVRARLLAEAPGWRDPVVRREMPRVFAAWADVDGRAGLLRSLDDRDARVRAAAVLALADDPDDAVGPRLLLAAADADPLVRATALDGLAARVAWGRDAGHRGVGDRAPRSPVPRSPVPGNPAAREVADAAARLFVAGSGDPDARVRLSALEGSVAMAGETAVFAVGKGLADPVWSVRLVAAELAGTVRDRGVLAPLVAALRDARERVARAASVALVRLTGIPFDDDVARWTSWLEGDGARFDPAEAPPPSSRAEGHARTAATARFLDLDLISSRVTFVLDASGSMSAREPDGRTRWERVVAELDRALERLGREAEGNVILFSNDAMALFPQAVRFTPAVRTKVRETLHARRPAGRTALYDGIALALDDAAVDSLVVLSDGVPSTGACLTRTDIRAELRRANRWRRARIDVISIGAGEVSERWKPLLEEIATDHGGRLLAK